MSSPLNDYQVEQWFQRLNAPLKRLPAEERVALHSEVRQHLDALVAANEELGSSPEEAWALALAQFGDPAQIGRKMYQEWQQGQNGFRADMRAILFGCSLQVVRWLPIQCLFYFQHGRLPQPDPLLLWMLGFPATTLISVGIGRKYPYQALKSALFWPFMWPIGMWAVITLVVVSSNSRTWTQLPVGDSLPQVLLNLIVYDGPTIFLSCAAAYLASVTKRGWYKPTLADFKLTLPRRRTRRLSPRG